jgi:hypothetical protein
VDCPWWFGWLSALLNPKLGKWWWLQTMRESFKPASLMV